MTERVSVLIFNSVCIKQSSTAAVQRRSGPNGSWIADCGSDEQFAKSRWGKFFWQRPNAERRRTGAKSFNMIFSAENF